MLYFYFGKYNEKLPLEEKFCKLDSWLVGCDKLPELAHDVILFV